MRKLNSSLETAGFRRYCVNVISTRYAAHIYHARRETAFAKTCWSNFESRVDVLSRESVTYRVHVRFEGPQREFQYMFATCLAVVQGGWKTQR